MQVFRTLDAIAGKFDKVCLAIGVFDGVHLGHQRVIGQARDDAQTLDGVSVALTFDPHPMHVLQPGKTLQLLTATEHKLRLIEKLKVEACLVLTFDRNFSLLPPQRFVEMILQAMRIKEICVGTRFRFGHDRAGDVRLLEALGTNCNFVAREIKPVRMDGEMISSTAIRQHVLEGRLERAAMMLGRSFSILGSVQPGDHRGHGLGFPTANLDPRAEALPPDGVYVVRVLLEKDNYSGVANIGKRPTFESSSSGRVLEVHILDFNSEIYGQDIEVEFVKKLRDERKFDSVKALKEQISADAQAARDLLG